MPDPYTGPVLPLDDEKKPAKQPYTGEVVALPGQPDQYGVHDVGETVSSERARGPKGIVPFANDVVRNVAEGVTFGGADKLAAFLDSQFGKGSYDELLARQRKETEEASGRLGPVGTFLAQAGGGMLTGSALARYGATLLGRLPATASLPMKILAGLGEGAAYGAASGVGHTDTGKVEDYLRNAGEGGLLGAATGGAVTGVAGVVPRVITPNPITDPVREAQNATLKVAGVNTSAGQRVGNFNLRMTEDAAAKLPFGRDPAAGQMEKVTQAAMREAGIGGGGKPTADVLDTGFKKIGGTIGNIQGKQAIDVDNQLLNTAAHVESNLLPLAGEGRQKTIQRFVDKVTSGQQLTPEMAQATRTQLNQAIKGQNGPMGDKDYQDALITLRNGLDDALERSILRSGRTGAQAEVDALKAARRQYAQLHVLTDALAHSGDAGLKGELTPTALAGALKRSVGQTGFMTGHGDLNDLARASSGLIRPPDSGTSTREGLKNPAAWLMGPVLRGAITSRPAQGYLGNQVMPIAPSGAQMQPAVAGATAGARPAGLLQPIDELWRGILRP